MHVGDVASQQLGITNAATGALCDVLTGGFGTVSVPFAASGSLGAGVASGANGALTVALNTTDSGTFSGTATLALASHDSELADAPLVIAPLTLSGTVDNYAVAAFDSHGSGGFTQTGQSYTLDLGTVYKGTGFGPAQLDVRNAASGLADLLSGSFAITGSSAFTNTGFGAFSGLGAGQAGADSTITLSAAAAGTFSETITLAGTGSNAGGYAGALAPEAVTVTGTVLPAYVLTKSAVTITAGSGDDVFVATDGTLVSGDKLDGGGGTNKLVLSGGGTFNLATPSKLANIQVVTAQEGQGATAQTVTLRAGLNAAVNVASDTAGDPSPGITIIGAANTAVITLGAGNDTVTLGAGETVISGGGNNSFSVASPALAKVTITGGTTGTNTLTVTGGGTTAMGAGISGVATVQLAAATSFTANAASGLQIIGSTGADKIIAGGAGQVLTGGAGADTLTGSAAGSDTFRDTAAGLNADTIVNLLPSDVIDITNLAPATSVITNYQVTAARTVLTLTDGSASTTITLSGAIYPGSFALAADGTGGTTLRFLPDAARSTFTLPSVPVTIAAGPVSSRIVATATTLPGGDSITGGTGTGVINEVLLSGGGAFNLASLSKLANIQVITAQEGQGATAQTVTLPAGLNATVNVTADTTGDPSPGITIIGAANTAVINLGPGADTVTPGAGETVNGGAGSDTYNVTATTIGQVTINGGAASNILVVNGGGTASMGNKIAGITAVQLTAPTAFTANATPGLTITGSSAGGDTITLGTATQSVTGGGANELVKASVANAGAAVSGLGANSTLEVTTGGTTALNAATSVTTVKLDAASTLTLNAMSFITAVGSNGADTIKAGATQQTLTGGAGADTLIGYAGGYDTFRDTAAGLNGDTIQGFVATDAIDLTDLGFTGAAVSAVASGVNTRVTVTSGASKSVFTVAGSWSAAGFHLASDGAAGIFVTHT